MKQIDKLLCIVVCCVALPIIGKFLDVGVCLKRNTLTNRQAGRNVARLRQERVKTVTDLQQQVNALKSRLNALESAQAPCDLMGFEFKQED